VGAAASLGAAAPIERDHFGMTATFRTYLGASL